MLTFIPCPDCGVVAEVTDRFVLQSTSGPADHVALLCAAGHCFRMLAEALPRESQQLLQAQRGEPTRSPRGY